MLSRKEKNGINYFEIYACCPECHYRGISVNQTFVLHKDCGGKMYAGDNGHYLCELCNDETPVNYWEIECDCNSQSELLLLKKTEQPKSSIQDHISLVGQIVDTTGVSWLQKFLENINPEES